MVLVSNQEMFANLARKMDNITGLVALPVALSIHDDSRGFPGREIFLLTWIYWQRYAYVDLDSFLPFSMDEDLSCELVVF